MYDRIERRGGLSLPNGFPIDIKLIENVPKSEAGTPAMGGGMGSPGNLRGFINIYLPVIAASSAGISPGTPEQIINHELVHVAQNIRLEQKLMKWPLWLTEGMASYVGETNGYLALMKGVEPVGLDKSDKEMGAAFNHPYGRGLLFFNAVESRFGTSGVKNLIHQLVNEKKEYRKAVESTTGMTWKSFVEAERTWSQNLLQGKPLPATQKPAATPKHDLQEALQNITFPPKEKLTELGKENVHYREIIREIDDLKRWSAAMSAIQERTGLSTPPMKIKVDFSPEKSVRNGVGGYSGGAGQVIFYLQPLSEFRKIPNAVNNRAIEFVLTHELTHVYLQYTYPAFKDPFWLSEGICEYAAQSLPNVLIQPTPLPSIDSQLPAAVAYGRGRLFLEYLSATSGGEKVKEFIRQVGGGASYEKLSAEIAGKSWKEIVRQEQEWSNAVVLKERSKYPGIQSGYGAR
ncbi:MAG: hypothetical protein A2Z34_10645 [Planctomycetes bacterium RBG_16_59_8]|nr:MAG: hypothetical protein A2Z34_10645 [Planctomycetes bacterium RBG_16_59_8]